MAIRDILFDDNPRLRRKARDVGAISQHTHMLLTDMAETMYAADGVGLAAPQVGVMRRMAVIDVGDGLLELINPVLLEREGEQLFREGCLSVPNYTAYVRRPESVRVAAVDRNGGEFVVTADGYLAVALCHEIDHLDGVLFIDKEAELTEEELARVTEQEEQERLEEEKEQERSREEQT